LPPFSGAALPMGTIPLPGTNFLPSAMIKSISSVIID
jgi:hypothetical protein